MLKNVSNNQKFVFAIGLVAILSLFSAIALAPTKTADVEFTTAKLEPLVLASDLNLKPAKAKQNIKSQLARADLTRDIVANRYIVKFNNVSKVDARRKVLTQLIKGTNWQELKELAPNTYLYQLKGTTAATNKHQVTSVIETISQSNQVAYIEPVYKLNTSKQPQSTKRETTKSLTKTTANTTQTLSTTDWITYQNTEHKFQLQYPTRFSSCCGISGPITGTYSTIATFGDVSGTANNDAPFDGFSVSFVSNIDSILIKGFSGGYMLEEIGAYPNTIYGPAPGEQVNTEFFTAGGAFGVKMLPSSADNITRYYIYLPDRRGVLVIAKAEKTAGSFVEFETILSTLQFNDEVERTFPTKDPFSSLSWIHNNTGQTGGRVGLDLNTPDAWAVPPALKTRTIIAVIEEGAFDVNHPDLAANVWKNPGEIAGNNIDDDANGYVDDVYGCGMNNCSDFVEAPVRHATWVSGIVAAIKDNNMGPAGVCPTCLLMATSGGIPLGMGEDADFSGIIYSYNYAIKNGAKVINNSWTSGTYSAAFEDIVLQAQTKGISVVAAAGNNNNDLAAYPANFAGVISVANINHNGQRSATSSYGTAVDISAPGSGLYTVNNWTGSDHLYSYTYCDDGTSCAAPTVSATIGLMLRVNPRLTPTQIESILKNTVTAFPTTPDKPIGVGILNTGAAVKSAAGVKYPLPR
jgi:hypothetical protein